MATTSNQLTDTFFASSSFSPASPPSWDVFLSFYGKDTRGNFVSHLYSALDQAGIPTFRDDIELKKGEQISSGLFDAINNSKMFVVVVSENYARSSWCLNELLEILRCNRTVNQIVPVFYYVDPSHLRYNKRSFEEAFKSHKKRYSFDKAEKWKSALAEISKLSGYHLKKNAAENESKTIQEIVEHVAKHTCTKKLHLGKYLVGINPAVEEIYQKLSMESNDVRALGICGMGGIGKTTTAKAFYNRYFHKFHISCFIENEREHPQGYIPLPLLLNRLLIELLPRKDYIVRNVESGMRKLKEILYSKKALIVLDDVHQSVYSEFVLRLQSLFFAGSRIIITTRDVNLLNQSKVDIAEADIYIVKELDKLSSLELFSYHAFRNPIPPESFRELTVSFATYAGGIPLALKVLGSSLCGRTDLSFWKAKLAKLGKIPEKQIQNILQLSYDDLDCETEKAMFLDIACFFVGKHRDEAFSAFISCNYFPDAGIPILIDRCLLTIDLDNKLQMHNLIRCMGLEIGKSRHLFLKDAWDDLQNEEEINKIEGLRLHFTKSPESRIGVNIFRKMSKLRLFEIHANNIQYEVKGKFKDLFHQLRYLEWHRCPWKYMPSDFRPRKLVSLDMSESQLKVLWRNPKQIKQLTDLSHLKLAYCYNLKHLPEHLGDLKCLKMINASHTTIEQLPDSIVCLSNLVDLRLHGCKKLRKLPKQLGNLKGLNFMDAGYTPINQLPDSVAGLTNLVDLRLRGCKKLRKLPKRFGNMESLKYLDACITGIEQLPKSFACLINLVELDLGSCKKLTNLPNNIWKLKFLKILNLSGCLKLERLPEELEKMQCLKYLNASSTRIKELPYSIGLLGELRNLDLSDCRKLNYSQNSIENLASLANLRGLGLTCNIRFVLPMIQSFSSLQWLSITENDGQSVSSPKPSSLSNLYNLQDLALLDCKSIGSSFPQLPLNLQRLLLHNYVSLEQLPDLCILKQLRRLEIRRCNSLRSVLLLPPQLKQLLVEECTSLPDVDLSMSKDLETLHFSQCSNLKDIHLKESFLKVGQNYLQFNFFRAVLPNRNIAEWFMYQSNGCMVSFDIPPNVGDVLGLAFWIVYKVVFSRKGEDIFWPIFTNKTQVFGKSHFIYAPGQVGEVHSAITCRRREDMDELFRVGGRINVSIPEGGNIQVQKFGVHVIQKTVSASC